MMAASAPGGVVRAPLDVTRITDRLYQGSRPRQGEALREAGFDVVVLSAREHQPSSRVFPGVTVIRALIEDRGVPMTRTEWQEAVLASQHVAHAVATGRRVLTTCAMGLNRSGLINALTLHRLSGMPGMLAVAIVRRARPGALSNAYFVAALCALPRRAGV